MSLEVRPSASWSNTPDLMQHVCEYLDRHSLLTAERINHQFRGVATLEWSEQARRHGVPESIIYGAGLWDRARQYAASWIWPSSVGEQRLLTIARNLLPIKQNIWKVYQFGREGWKQALGIDIGPIPNIPDISEEMWQKLRKQDPWDTKKTVGETSLPIYIPDRFSITVKDSSLGLIPPVTPGSADRLVMGGAVIPGTRTLQGQITISNLWMLFSLRVANDHRFASCDQRGLLDQFLDAPVETTGWRILRKDMVEPNAIYTHQQQAVQNKEGWEILSLIETSCLHFLRHLSCDKNKPGPYGPTISWGSTTRGPIVRTSTQVLYPGDGMTSVNIHWPIAFVGGDWRVPGPRIFYINSADSDTGVAVGMIP